MSVYCDWSCLDRRAAATKPTIASVAADVNVRQSHLTCHHEIAGTPNPRGRKLRGRVVWLTLSNQQRPRDARFAIALLLGGAPLTLHAQAIVRVSERSACSKCEIVIEQTGTFADSHGVRTLPGMPSLAADDRHGRIWLSFVARDARPRIYDAQARLTAILPKVEGNASYTSLTQVTLWRDTAYVYYPRAMTMTVFGPSLRQLREAKVSIPAAEAMIRLGNGNIVTAALLATPEEVGFPLHAYDSQGKLKKSFGATSEVFSAEMIPQLRRRIAAATDPNEVWAAHVYRYDIELWDTNGRLKKTYERRPDWFSTRKERPVLPSSRQAPQPFIQAIRQDSAGLIWVLINVASPSWRTAADFREMRATRTDSLIDTPQHMDRLLNTVIEVIDPATGSLLASKRLPAALNRILDDQHAMGLRQLRRREWEADLWTFRLERPPTAAHEGRGSTSSGRAPKKEPEPSTPRGNP